MTKVYLLSFSIDRLTLYVKKDIIYTLCDYQHEVETMGYGTSLFPPNKISLSSK